MNEAINELTAATDNCHNLLYIIKKIEEYQDDLSKQDIINLLYYYYYIFNKDIFNDIL